jgi:hypothetical protein
MLVAEGVGVKVLVGVGEGVRVVVGVLVGRGVWVDVGTSGDSDIRGISARGCWSSTRLEAIQMLASLSTTNHPSAERA